MKRYVGTVLLLFVISILVSFKHEYYANGSAKDGDNKGLAVSTNNPAQAKGNSSQTDDDAKRWWERGYLFFGWPNGITIWALILTMIVIAEQTMETRKAAENAGRALVFQQEMLRPRLTVNNFLNDVFREAVVKGERVSVNMEIFNSGGLPAYGVIADTWIEFVWGKPSYKFSPQAKYARADSRLNVHAASPTGFLIPLGRKLTEEERSAMGQAEGTICFRVKLIYQAFGGEVYTDEAWSTGPNGMQSIAEYSSET